MTERPLLLLLLFFLMKACSTAFDPDIRTGVHPYMADGNPVLMFSAIAFADEDKQPVIDLDLDVVYSSLIYRQIDGKRRAKIVVQTEIFRVIDESEDEIERVEFIRETVDIAKSNRNDIRSGRAFTYKERINVDPGDYMVVVRVTDENSNKSTQRRSNVTVFDPSGPDPFLTHIKLSGIKNGEKIPLTTYSIPGDIDTITFTSQVIHPSNEFPLNIEQRLVRFASDTLPPRPISGITPTTGSLQYRGIDYSDTKIMNKERMVIEEAGVHQKKFTTERPSRGNYRFEIEIITDDGRESRLYKARDFGSMSGNFPNIMTTREMARPLVYLMRRGEYRDLMEIEESDSLKRQIDRFWLSNVGDVERAGRVIKKYYERVEEANKQFSNFKEGWMTDLGMVYILFGAPWYVEQSLDTMVWIYGYNRADPERVFYFQRTRVASDRRPFEHYVLQRYNQYHSVEYEQIQRWISGRILTSPL